MSVIFVEQIQNSKQMQKMLSHMNKVTREWEMRAARGECSWVCADCSVTFPTGMPDKCIHEYEKCTKIIQRDKEAAKKS